MVEWKPIADYEGLYEVFNVFIEYGGACREWSSEP